MESTLQLIMVDIQDLLATTQKMITISASQEKMNASIEEMKATVNANQERWRPLYEYTFGLNLRKPLTNEWGTSTLKFKIHNWTYK